MADRHRGQIASGLTSAQREPLGEVWTQYALEEHASIASFARFIIQAVQLGAPASLVESASRALCDEIRHSQLCFSIASQLLDRDVGPGPFESNICTSFPASMPAIIAATIREGCILETIAVAYAREARRQAVDATISDVLATIVADEARHSELAWTFVEWAADTEPRLRQFIHDTFEDAFEEIARADADQGDRAPETQPFIQGYGVITPAEERTIRREMIESQLRPRANSLFSESAGRENLKITA